MGIWQSIATKPTEDMPQISGDIIQSIIQHLPSTVIIENARLVNKKWRKIGERNVIWIPRYKALTRVSLNPEDYKQGEIYHMFVKEWDRTNHVYLKDGKIYKTSNNLAWVNVVHYVKQAKNHLAEEVFPGRRVYVSPDGNFMPPPLPQIIIEDDGVVRAANAISNRYDYPAITLLTTVQNQNPKLWRIIRRLGEYTRVIPVTYEKKVVEHHDENENIYLSQQCTICTKPAMGICSQCGIVAYCGVKCQQQDWLQGHCH